MIEAVEGVDAVVQQVPPKDELYGVSYAHLGALKKKIKGDHELARQLWESGVHDARILALLIANPAQGVSVVDDWAKEASSYVITDGLATFAAQTSPDPQKIEKWMKSQDEWIGCFG